LLVTMDQMNIPSFRTPPVSEVAAGVQFDQITPFQARYFGQFWNEMSADYPETQDAAPVPDAAQGAITMQIMFVPPLRRMLLISRDQQFLIQLQDTRFHHNWRRVNKDTEYPRFPEVYRKFLASWERFVQFVQRQGLPQPRVTRYELTYVNEIEIAQRAAASEVERYVQMYVSLKNREFLPEPASVSAAWQFVLPEGKGQLHANLSPVRKPDGKEAMALALNCVGPATKHYAMSEWFQTAHEWIVRGFADLTTAEAHQKWGRER
jgi:uncharacterized protein (TIGR04255 family)